MVQSKADRERQKLITDKCQSLIEVLLKDEDNKYCVDCDAKGPRWASWNLGVFLCIRCAGIHRNLGVHISKVKSVNLDAWTPEHVAYVQRMGNSRARAIYEANLPDDFRRPQTDTALESFIRAKYEHKKYIAQDYVDPGPPPPAFNIDDELKRIKEQKRSKATSNSSARMITVPDLPTPPNSKPRSTDSTVAAATATTAAAPTKSNTSALDLLVQLDLDSTPMSPTVGQPSAASQQTPIQNANLSLNLKPEPLKPASSSILDLDLDFSASPATQTSQVAAADNSKPKVLTKESILSLYSTDPFGMNK